MEYEYCSLFVDPSHVGIPVDVLNGYGFKGWQLVTTLPQDHGFALVFMRQKQAWRTDYVPPTESAVYGTNT